MRFVTNEDRKRELANDPSKSKFVTKQGRLTQWAMVCGYVEDLSLGTDDNFVRLYLECGSYFVRTYDGGQRKYWESFDNIRDARKALDSFANPTTETES